MVDLSTDTIQQLFYQQIRNVTMRSLEDTMDLQFSDGYQRFNRPWRCEA